MTGRMIGYGTILQATTAGGTTASTNAIAFIRDGITGPAASRGTVDATPLSSTAYREFMAGLIDGQELSLPIMFSTTSRGPVQLAGWMASERNPLACKIVFPTATVTMKFKAHVSGLEMAFPRDDLIMANCTMKLTSGITWPTSSM